MNKEWLETLASDIEAQYGEAARARLIGDIDSIKDDAASLSAWFENFTTGMDGLNDKEFLQKMMAERCPCGGSAAEMGKIIKEHYESSETLAGFVESLRKSGTIGDEMELRGNVLYMIKPLSADKETGRCGTGCHCMVAKHAEKNVSDIFCHCCTIGHTGGMFKHAFGDGIKMEFIESIICGGTACTMAVHLPGK